MNTRMELCRIGGVPIYLDMLFVLVLVMFTHRYFTSGDMQLVSAGLLIVAGLLLSILLHELGHAFAARLFGVRTAEIELTGLGGVARFANALPRSAFAKSIIFLGGPAANLALWLGFDGLAGLAIGGGNPFLWLTLTTLGVANFYLLVFNLLPAYPLDGGRTLEVWLGAALTHGWAVRIVAVLGLVVTAGCVVYALPTNFWMLLLAFVLYQSNWGALQSVGGINGRS